MIISLLNEKGGVGKSTLTANLAVFFKKHFNKNVLLVDSDNQRSLRAWHSRNQDIDLVAMDTAQSLKSLKKIGQSYDLVFVDGAGRAGFSDVSIETIKLSNLIIVPTQPAYFDFLGCSNIIEGAKVRKEMDDNLEIRILFNRVIPRTGVFKEANKSFSEYNLTAFDNFITQRVAFAELAAQGKSVIDRPTSKAYQDISDLAHEIMQIPLFHKL